MIQRKQTLFLLISFGLLLSMLFLPLATAKSFVTDGVMKSDAEGIVKTTVVGQGSEILMTVWGLKDGAREIMKFTFMIVLVILATALPFVTIFMYSRRKLQIRMCYVQWVLLLGVMVFQALYYIRLSEMLAVMPEMGYTIVPGYANIFSLISIVLTWFAYRGIVRDEALVRSLDRIR